MGAGSTSYRRQEEDMAAYIKFEISEEVFNGKPTYDCCNKRTGTGIAQIFWYKPWKKWTCRFNPDSVWSEDCLQDIRNFILILGKES